MNAQRKNGNPSSRQHVIVGKLTGIGKRHITLGAGTQISIPDQRLLDGIEIGMSLTLVVARRNGAMIAERIVRFDEGTLFTRGPGETDKGQSIGLASTSNRPSNMP